MDIKDIQNERDTRNVEIDRVGVTNVRYPIIVQDRALGVQHTVADLDIFVNLPHHHRGTHMSRFLEVLNRYHRESLVDALPDFLADIKRSLSADSAYTILRFPYFITKKAPVSGIESLLGYDCFFEATLDTDYTLILGVAVPITTLCPCSKEISRHGAHNQRSMVRVRVGYRDFIWLEELIEKVESVASCEIYPLLKRRDEKYVTEKAYENPKFVEDIVRDLTLLFEQDQRITHYRIESENMESIHNHNAYASVTRNKTRSDSGKQG